MAQLPRDSRVATRRKQRLDQVTAWVNPQLGIKARMDRVREIDHRQTYSRIAEDAIMHWLPQLERQLLPYEAAPPRRKLSTGS